MVQIKCQGGDLHQLVNDIAEQLQRKPDQPAGYNDKLEKLIAASDEANKQGS